MDLHISIHIQGPGLSSCLVYRHFSPSMTLWETVTPPTALSPPKKYSCPNPGLAFCTDAISMMYDSIYTEGPEHICGSRGLGHDCLLGVLLKMVWNVCTHNIVMVLNILIDFKMIHFKVCIFYQGKNKEDWMRSCKKAYNSKIYLVLWWLLRVEDAGF